MSSRRLAVYLEELGTYGREGVAFLIGGAEGLAARVLEVARYRLAVSPMTLSHDLTRVVLLEQLYRAGTIIRGEPYHRGP
jgi:23S rRNA (pseudouridine1915-N3)-methyltransferase